MQMKWNGCIIWYYLLFGRWKEVVGELTFHHLRLPLNQEEVSVIKKQIIIMLALLLAACTSPAMETTVEPRCGLVAYYPFTENANDLSGNGNHGSVYGAKLSVDSFLPLNQSYKFDGLESYIDLGADLSLKMTNGLTLSVWVKPETFEPIYQNILSDHSINELAGAPGKILRLYHNEVQFHVGGVFGIGTAIYTAYPFENSALGSWHQIVGTYDREIINLFVDGKKVDSRMYSEPLPVNDNPLLIGKSGFGEYFKGSIDDVRIYDRAIPEAEIEGFPGRSAHRTGC